MMIKGKIKKLDPERIPVYEIVVEDGDETGISLISLVEDPAMMIKGMAFSNQSSMSFKEVSADKQIIVGPALIPNMRIYREDEKYGKYYVMFSKETIAKMVEKFNKFGSNRRINIDHSNEMVDAFIIEDWITEDLVYDKSRKYGFEVPVGTYMIMVKIEDTDFWNEEVRGNGKFGFSIEGMLGQQLVNLVKQEATIDDLTLDDLFEIFELGKYEKGVPHYTADGELYEGPTHKDATGRLMTGGEHTEDSEYLYHKEELAVIGPRGGIKKSPKAPKSSTPNKNPEGRGTSKGDSSTTRGSEVPKAVEEALQKKADEFNEKYKEKLGYGVNLGMLKTVYQRGVGAFTVSHSPKVSSSQQWAYARVNAFLYIVKNGRPENPKYKNDNDLLPKKHPKKSEMSFSEMTDEIVCEDCGWSWTIETGGDDPYVCHKCGGNGILKIKLESYTDYPDGVKSNARKVLDYTEKNGWGSCGTPVGKVRANQLAKGEAISLETIKRMFSYLSRHEVDLETSTSYSVGCGKLMYDSWGGKAALGWSRNKLRELGELDENMKFSDIFVTDSSNVDRLKYFEEKRELVIKFNDGSYYTYSNIDADEFNAIVEGDAVCRTSGSNEFGEWEIGKTPSVGAAVWKYLIDKNNVGKAGGSFY